MENSASDAAPLSPGGAVADLSASEGTTGNDQATSPAMSLITVPLVGNRVTCPECEKRETNLFFLNLSDLDRHLTQHHPDAPIFWSCINCAKCFPKLHGARCHIPKCGGASSQARTGQFYCEACPMSFGSRRGLSTHERHAHPAVRNIKRRGADPPEENTKSWRVEEVALLKGLWGIFKNHKYPNKEISKFLTTKTIDQIKYQRKKLNLIGEESPQEAISLATEGGCDLVSSGNASFGSPVGRNENEERIHEWKLSLKNEINKPTEVPPILKEVYNRLMLIWEEHQDDRDSLTESLDHFIRTALYELINKINKNQTDLKIKRAAKTKSPKNNRNSRKRFSYARCQELFHECPRRLADAVVNNDQAYLEPARQPPGSEEVRGLYEKLWGQVGSTYVPIPVTRAPNLSLSEIFPPITAEDVGEKIGRIRKKAAAGPDGLQRDHLTIPGLPIIMAKIYNILIYCSYFPSAWKENRTTLIPKANKPSSRVENWRPITISPILGRIFSSIIDGRIRRGVVLNMRQKGFTSENGCKINIELLNSALNHSKRNRGGIFTIVDISKAFDTVPHAALKPCLAKKGVPDPIVELIDEMYKNTKTTIKTKDGGVEILIRRGVKQGDPLSPLLFNICLEPLLEEIEEQVSGINVTENRQVSVLAFADDIVLLGADAREAQHQINILTSYLESLQMKLSIEKCQTFEVVAKKDTWFIKEPGLKIGKQTIPNVDPDEAFKYLGAKIGPWKGVHCGVIVPELLSVVKRVRKLSLKPGQKLELLIKYIFPRYIYHLLVSPPSDTVLKLLDSEVRQEVKIILHLMPSTATGFFYTPKACGGLGLPRFEHIVKLGTLKSAIKIANSIDPAVAGLIDEAANKKLKLTANSLRINWPASLEDIEKARKRLRKEHISQWADLKCQGQGVPDFIKNKTGNLWLEDHSLLKPSRLIDALRLRTNTFGTRSVLARADKNIDVTCRRCRAQPETLGHILGLCQHTKGLRIKRHDEVKSLLEERLKNNKKNEVFVEPTIKAGGSLFKPDLVIKNGERVLVVDVTVRYENKNYLALAEKEKVEKYRPCLKALKEVFNAKGGEILPVVLGSRGTITPNTEKVLKRLGIANNDIKTMLLNVLRSSIELCNIFIDD